MQNHNAGMIQIIVIGALLFGAWFYFHPFKAIERGYNSEISTALSCDPNGTCEER